MRIAFSGTANTGKSTLVRDFLTVWNMYSTPSKTYRDVIVEQGLQINKIANKAGQGAVLDFMVSQMRGKTSEDNIVYDRCPLDNIVYSMWASNDDQSDIDDNFIRESIAKVRQSFKDIDIIFWLPYSKNIPIKDDKLRDTDVNYIIEINNIFDEIYTQYMVNDKFYLFDSEDRPAIIPITTVDRALRLKEISNYISLDGALINPDNKWLQELQGTPVEGTQEQIKSLLKEQKETLLKETGVIVT